MQSFKTISRFAGLGYLVIFITGIVSNFAILENIIVPGDAAATSANIINQESLFRTGMLGFVIMVIFDLFLTWALYLLLKPVSRDLSLLSAWMRLVNVSIFAVALFHLFTILNISNNAAYLDVFDPQQLHAQIMLSLDDFNNTWLIGLIFFGLHLGVLGYLIVKSGYIPKFIGVLLFLASGGYLADSFAHILLSDYEKYKDLFSMIVIVPGVIGELSLTFWLLFKAGKLSEKAKAIGNIQES